MILICTPAGFGKSELMQECVAQAPSGTTVAWLSLGGKALGPADLLVRLAESLSVVPGPGDVQVELCRLISRLEQPTWIILDDYPRVPSAELDASLELLLTLTPHKLRWWINGRRRPAWNLPRLFLQGDLHELDAQALALDEEELGRLLIQHRLALSADLTRQLMAQSEGWPAVVRLLLADSAATSLAQHIANGTAMMRDYLRHDVLDNLPAELLSAVRPLADMSRFSVSLCEYLLEDQDGTDVMDQLTLRGLLRRSPANNSDSDSFRVWRPLATVLKSLPSKHSASKSHVRACQWFARHGEMSEAVEHALKAGQPELAVNYLQDWPLDRIISDGRDGCFLQWCDALPDELLSVTPSLVLLRGWTLLLHNYSDKAERCLEGLERFLPQPGPDSQRDLLVQFQAIVAVISCLRGRGNSRQQCLEALQSLDVPAWPQRILCHQALARQSLAKGDLDAGQDHITQALSLARQRGSLMFEASLGVERVHLLIMRGEPGHALEQVEQLLLDLENAALVGPIRGRLLLLRGSLLAGMCRDELAEECTWAGLLEAERVGDGYVLQGYRTLVDLATSKEDFSLARRLLDTAERRLQALGLPEAGFREALAWMKGKLLLAQGWGEMALDSIRWGAGPLDIDLALVPGGCYDLVQRAQLLAARAHLSLGQDTRASMLLQGLLEDCQRAGHRGLERECLLDLAEILYLEGQTEAASQQLCFALREVDHLALLAPLRSLQRRHPGWLEQLAELDSESSRSPGDTHSEEQELQLSPREQEVLELIAEGLSNQQIAERLHISVHTVKSHAWHINGKLGVERRTHAVAKAKAEGVL
ncbi:LuxR C-terminal-related transcriptional regulator [Aquipseudomonas alcaligenes]|uniref:LuxR C-terminal-related transcriptional regulator n=1 Tax=Aquipseudomonas alcaligenes TaxID=43263 RepID=UPI00165984A8|nr:LuxR C-terminal-related transcriptional regulator [Pseudomonas alcaligenes]